jgi:oligopeptide transport system permease protein
MRFMETGYRKLTPDLCEAAGVSVQQSERVVGPPVGFWQHSWRRLKKNREALISLGVIVFLFAMAFVTGPLLAQHSPYSQDLAHRYSGPTSEYCFGTDTFGRDMWARVSSMVFCLIMVSFSLLGDGLRDALDPKMRR